MTSTPDPDSAPRPSTRTRLIVVAAVLVVAAAVVTVLVWPHSAASRPKALPTTVTTQPSSAPVPVATPTPTPMPSPSVAPVPHDVVVAAAPTSFHFSGPGVDIRAHVCGMANIRPLDPPGEQHHTVCWVQQGFGVAPSTTSATTYVLGHAWGQDDQEVLNQISSRAMVDVLKAKPVRVDGIITYPVHSLDHDMLTLHTRTGTLTYTVADAYAVGKQQAGYLHSLMDQQIAHRVVIITCGELNHRDYDYNIIVDAYLTSSLATPAMAAG